MREHWRETGFWRWWWRQRVPVEAKIGAAVVAAAALSAGGYLASQLPGAHAGAVRGAYVEIRTVKVVTVRERGKVVRRLVPVVKRVLVRPRSVTRTRTSYQTTTISRDGTTRVVTTVLVRPVRVIQREQVTTTSPSRPQTVVVTDRRPGSTSIRTVTNQQPGSTSIRTVTDQQPAETTTTVRTVTDQQPTTSVRTVTGDPVTSTRTVTNVQPTTVLQTTTATVTRTTTAPAITVTTTLPAITTTTTTTTRTTTTPAVTVTTTLPAVTVTVTVPKPKEP